MVLAMAPEVSFVVPARDEATYLPTALAAIDSLDTDREYQVVVVADRRSEDGTVTLAREREVRVVEQTRGSIGQARNLGARAADGDWLAFVDADTRVRPDYLDAMLACVDARGLDAASSRCRMVGDLRGKPMEWVVNYLFPRLSRPVLPGFNFFLAADVHAETGGFPDVPNEDTAYSRRLADSYETGFCRAVLVESSARRFRESGLTGTLVHYLKLDARRLRSTDG